MKIADSLLPVNQSISENISDKKAEANNNLSAVVNFFSMLVIFICLIKI